MLNFHRISGMHIVIVSCDEADQIRTDSVFEMAKGRYYIRQISKLASPYILWDYCRVTCYVKHMEGIL